MGVVVPEVGHQDGGQVAVAEDENPVGTFTADSADPAFGDGVGAGARIGVRMIAICSEVNTVSKPATNLLSRSRITKRSCSTGSVALTENGRVSRYRATFR